MTSIMSWAKSNITRNQAIEIAGEDAVHALEGVNCQPTGRVGFNGACQGDELCEWASSLTTTDTDGDHVTVRAYYFTTNEQDREMREADGDGSVIEWEISHYEII